MLKKLKIIIYVCILTSIGAVTGYHFAVKKLSKESTTIFVDSTLYNLNIEMDILMRWKEIYADDKILEGQIKRLILNEIMALSVLEPDISNLKGIPLEALNRLLAFNGGKDLTVKGDERIFQPASNYLNGIKNDVVDELIERTDKQKTIFRNQSQYKHGGKGHSPLKNGAYSTESGHPVQAKPDS